MVAATLALLALMLAFAFGLAASRHDVRRGLVVDEANAIGTTYLRAALLPEPHRTGVRALLREYVDIRLEAVEPGKLSRSIRRSEELHARLWAHAVAVGRRSPLERRGPLHRVAERRDRPPRRTPRAGAGNRIPGTIWTNVLRGDPRHLRDGVPRRAGRIGQVAGDPGIVLAFSAVMTLIADLDRPQAGMLRVSQQAMTDLRNSFMAKEP